MTLTVLPSPLIIRIPVRDVSVMFLLVPLIMIVPFPLWDVGVLPLSISKYCPPPLTDAVQLMLLLTVTAMVSVFAASMSSCDLVAVRYELGAVEPELSPLKD